MIKALQLGNPMSTLSQVKILATQVRTWAVAKADKANYNPDTLCGWCAIASGELFKRLEKVGIKSTLHINSGHTFVTVDDHVVDVTATQFMDYEDTPVLIAHQKEVEDKWYYQDVDSFTSIRDLYNFQKKTKWPVKQRVRLTA